MLFHCLKWFPAYGMQGLAADTKTWAACPTRAVLRLVIGKWLMVTGNWLLHADSLLQIPQFYIPRLDNASLSHGAG